MLYGYDDQLDCVRQPTALTSVQEVPCWILETRWRIAQVLPYGPWEPVLEELMDSDTLAIFADELSTTKEPHVQYRVRLHPDYGNEVRTL